MATAANNIEGATRLSEKDGAGDIVASRADAVAMNTSNAYGHWGAMAYSCTTEDTYSISMSLTAGKKTRVVIVWNKTQPCFLWQPNQRRSGSEDLPGGRP